jgi:hypothetical protein
MSIIPNDYKFHHILSLLPITSQYFLDSVSNTLYQSSKLEWNMLNASQIDVRSNSHHAAQDAEKHVCTCRDNRQPELEPRSKVGAITFLSSLLLSSLSQSVPLMAGDAL